MLDAVHQLYCKSKSAVKMQWQIIQRLPEMRTQIIDRLAFDPEFQSLCLDYNRCSEALGGFCDQTESLPERVSEYEELLSELESDIRRQLSQT